MKSASLAPFLLLFAAAAWTADSTTIGEVVPLVRLIANPKESVGKVVRVEGVLAYGFESRSLYLTTDHYRHGVASHAAWLQFDRDFVRVRDAELKGLNGKYVIVQGTVLEGPTGHLSSYPVALVNVSEVRPIRGVTSSR